MNPVRLLFGWNELPIWTWEVPVWGRRLRACTFDRLLNLYLHRFGLMGKDEKQIFAEHIRPGLTVVDVGANQGLYALLFAGLVGPSGSVLAFEPDPELFASLEGNCRRNQATNIKLHHCALGAQRGAMTLCRSRVNSGDNRLAKSDRMKWFREVPVTVNTLDDLIGSTRVDFIKIDVQGWELEVFKGMTGVFRANPQVRIYFEFWPYGLRKAGSDPVQVLHHLQTHSFLLHEWHQRAWRQIDDAEEFCRGINEHRYINLLALPSAAG